MIWLVVPTAITAAAGVAIWCGLAIAKIVYGYPVLRHLARRATSRLGENRFLAADVQELDEAFRRVASSHIGTD